MDYKELNKILLMDKPSKVLKERREELGNLIPEFRETFDFDQHTIWHQYDVYEHTLHVVDEVMPDLRLRLAALFHDIGKPRLMTIDEQGEGHFHYHWEESEDIFIKYQNRFNLSEEDIYLIRKLIFYHDLTIKDNNINLFLQEFDSEGIKLLLDLKKSDAMAHSEEFVPGRLKALEEAKQKISKEQKRLGLKVETQEDEKALLLAILCNTSNEFTFKARKNNKHEFLVGLSTLDGILTYPISLEYWNYFDIPEIENIANLTATPKSEIIKKLELILKNKTNSGGKR